jgi:F-type H+-transporting ATPase subunit gamma
VLILAQSTKEIKRRIRGVSSTKQITKAMELVSSSKLKRARRSLEASRPYYNTVLENIQDILNFEKNLNHPLLAKREIKGSLYIVVSADRGLAGGYNSSVIRLVEEAMRENGHDSKLITIGTKARDYFKRRDHDISESFVGISESPDFYHAKKIGEKALELYKEKQVDEINIVFTRFLSTISQEPKILKLLPSEEVEKESGNKRVVVEFEPSTEEVLSYLIPKYIQSSIYGALIEASASEQASRRLAMEAATENAEEIIEELEISFNRARQAAITMEISEIVSGADALK